MADYETLLRDHVVLNVRSVDRVFLQAYVPKLQCTGQVCKFLRWTRGFRIPSSAAFGQIGDRWVAAVKRYAKARSIPMITFEKGQNKEETARPYLEQAAKEGRDCVALIGVAQEKATVWRSWKAKGQEKAAHPHMEWGRQSAYVNHYYFYIWDSEWGGCFWKANAYAPFPFWLWLNGHEWAKRQLEKSGIGYEALDNGFRSCSDPVKLQEICDSLGAEEVRSFVKRWYRRLPTPLNEEDWRAGYKYDLAFRQFEVSETMVFDRPQSGRSWFEGVIRDHLDIGRPDQIALIFDRRIGKRTPGTFRSRVIQHGVDPLLTCYYKDSNRLKQYFKEGRALRTEMVICDTRDFGIGRRVTAENWKALVAVGESANQRLLDAEAKDAMPAPDVATFEEVTRPSINEDGQYAPGLRFGDPRVMAVLAVLVNFAFLVDGFTNRQLVQRVSQLLLRPYSCRHATYDLRRLKRKGLIRRRTRSLRYDLTPKGRRVAVLFSKTYSRVLTPALSATHPELPECITNSSRLAQSWRRFERTLNDYNRRGLRAA
ncbi:MAG TPA: hypothetical protein VMT85_04105 [Thermoanaerobaculia bacterium]|nr:hypothetical protein [Thermoanaerobaculia bacterium]